MGRPAFEPTDEQKKTVSIAAGSGQMSHEQIAIGLGIDRKTLEKHFEAELSQGAYARRLEVIEQVHAAALKGNVTAARAYLANEPGLAVPPQPKDEPLGKKDQANKDATTAHVGTDWEDDLKPRGHAKQPTLQ